MGDYNALRFVAKLSPLGEVLVAELHRAATLRVTYSNPWLAVVFLDARFASYAHCPRSFFIPFGGLQDCPISWVDGADELCNWLYPAPYTGAPRLDVVDGVPVWTVCCGIKFGFRETINQFLYGVLPFLIAEPCEVDVFWIFGADDGEGVQHRAEADLPDGAGWSRYRIHPGKGIEGREVL